MSEIYTINQKDHENEISYYRNELLGMPEKDF